MAYFDKHSTLYTVMVSVVSSTVADPGFPRREYANLLFDKVFQNFSEKLHENEKNWLRGGGVHPWRLRSATVQFLLKATYC